MTDKKIMNKEATEKAVAEATELLKKYGVDSFILLFQPVAGLTTVHHQDVKIKDALSMLITGIQETIKLAVEKDPAQNKALVGFLQEFKLLIKKTNEQMNIKEIPTA